MAGNEMREQARAAREAQEAAQKRRDRMIGLVGGAVVAVVVIGIIVASVIAKNGKDSVSADSLPAGVDKSDYGVVFGAKTSGVPRIDLYEDFQCPACAAFEPINGDRIVDLAKQGKVTLVWHPASFLDDAKAAANQAAGNPNSSKRATAAWGCAIDAGKAAEYHKAVFANQPKTEGQGFSDVTLLTIGSQIIPTEKLATFSECVNSGKYASWAIASNQTFNKKGISSTPTLLINGKEQKPELLFDPTGKKLLDAIAAAK